MAQSLQSLESVLANIPGLAGVLAQRQKTQEQEMRESQMLTGQLQQAGGIMNLQGLLQKQQLEQQRKAVLQKTGGNLDQAVKELIRMGDTQGAHALAPLVEAQRKTTTGQPIGSGGLLMPDQTVIPPAARPTIPEEWGEPYNLGGATVQKNKKTGQIRSVVGREPGGISPQQRIVQQLGAAFERANLPEADAVLREVENTLTTTPQISEYLAGPKALLPDWAIRDQKITAGRQAFQKLFNITLKNRSGAAVTNPEFERLKAEFASGAWKKPEQIADGVKQARNIITQHYRSVASGFGADALKVYNENLKELGGLPVLETASPAAPSGWGIRPIP